MKEGVEIIEEIRKLLIKKIPFWSEIINPYTYKESNK
jgi:hypothetical protein